MNERKRYVTFINPNAEKSFEELKEGKFEEKQLYSFINRAINDLKQNPFCGIKIPQRLIPKEYTKKFGVNNLFKYNLPSYWRLIYTVKGDDIMIVSVILEWMDHKEYDRRFGY